MGGQAWRNLNIARRIDLGRFWSYMYGRIAQGTSSLSPQPDTVIYASKSSKRGRLPYLIDLFWYFYYKFHLGSGSSSQQDAIIINTANTQEQERPHTRYLCKGYTVSDTGDTVAFTAKPIGWGLRRPDNFLNSSINGGYLSYGKHDYVLDGNEVFDARVYNGRMVAVSGGRSPASGFAIYLGNPGRLTNVANAVFGAPGDVISVTRADSSSAHQTDAAGLYSSQLSIIDVKISPTLREICVILCIAGYDRADGSSFIRPLTQKIIYRTYVLTINLAVEEGALILGGESMVLLGDLSASLENTITYNFNTGYNVENGLVGTTFESSSHSSFYVKVEKSSITFNDITNITSVPANCYYIAGLYYEDNRDSLDYDRLQYVFYGAKGSSVGFTYAGHTEGVTSWFLYTPVDSHSGGYSSVYTYDLAEANNFSASLRSLLDPYMPGGVSFTVTVSHGGNIEQGFYLGYAFDSSTLLTKSGLQWQGFSEGSVMFSSTAGGVVLPDVMYVEVVETADIGIEGRVRYQFYPTNEVCDADTKVTNSATDSIISDRNVFVDFISNAKGFLAIASEIDPRHRVGMWTEVGYLQRAEAVGPDTVYHKDAYVKLQRSISGTISEMYNATISDVEPSISYTVDRSYPGPVSLYPFFNAYAIRGYYSSGAFPDTITNGDIIVTYFHCRPYNSRPDHLFTYDISESTYVSGFSSYAFAVENYIYVNWPNYSDEGIDLRSRFPGFPHNILQVLDATGIVASVDSVLTTGGVFTLLEDPESMLVFGAASS